MKTAYKKTIAGLLAITLAACGKTSGRKELDTALAGTYELTRIDGGSVDEGISAEEVANYKEYGLTCSLTLNEDGTAVMDNYGEKINFTWGGNTLAYTETGETIQFTVDDKILTVADEDSSQALVFSRASD